ncbi:MAG: 3-dehydroquinate synthase [Elusimicrobiota bacterium]|jgi:3-dehydroquinate synthase|nr:3-dehydroquinate synthase [Elusimicrobiota bacterium]
MNIILTGFMGTGKSSVSKELLKILNQKNLKKNEIFELLDTDEIIEKIEKRKISKIFETYGELYFRDIEAKIVKKIAKLNNKIISTGGGIVLKKENIDVLKKNGLIFNLYATPTKIFERLKYDNTRPLLKCDEPLSRITEILKARKYFYDNNHFSIDTTNLSIFAVAKKIEKIFLEFLSIRVKLFEKSYNIFIEDNSFASDSKNLTHFKIHKLIRDINPTKILVITDSNFSKYKKNFDFAIDNKNVFKVEIPAGEKYKNLKQIENLYKVCVNNDLDRKSLIIAVGGGVVGDMSGFVAATYLRGIKFIQVPTTLLAQVDASIGGKTGFDLEYGKNLVGAFYQPEFVWINTKFLSTLDEREYKNGLAEVLKYGIIYSKKYWTFFEKNIDKILNRDESILKEIVCMSAKVKSKIVSKDEKESNLRKILNLGHTLGHAMETACQYKFKHGEMVSFGILFASFASNEMKILTTFELEKIENLLKKVYIDKSVNLFDEIRDYFSLKNDKKFFEYIFEIMTKDKKIIDKKIDFVIPIRIGKVKIVHMEIETLKDYYKRFSFFV